MPTERFCHRLLQARENAGMNGRELASALGYRDSSTISEWERGRVTPSRVKIEEVARVLNVDPTWLAGAPRKFVTVAEVIARG